MKILFVSLHPLPEGNAYTNRIKTISKALLSSGNYIKVVCIKPSSIEQPIKVKKNYFKFKNYSFEYEYLTKINSYSSKFLKILHNIIGIIKLYSFLSLNKNVYDVIIFHRSSLIYTIPIRFSIVKTKTKFVLETCEYPDFIRSNKRNLINSILELYRYRVFDKIITMTYSLFNYHTDPLKTNKKQKFMILPNMVDTERFTNIKTEEKIDDKQYLAYVGYPYGKKDGVPIMLKAFSLVIKDFPNLYLYIIGGTKDENNKRQKILLNLVEKYNIKDKVIFMGRVKSTKIPRLLKNAILLLLARENNIQAQGGFPTKLVEYLASGTPVVVTSTGDIPKYLSHKKNAYLSKPSSVIDFSKKIIDALTNYNEALKIGENGKQLCSTIFSPEYQGKRLKEFLEN